MAEMWNGKKAKPQDRVRFWVEGAPTTKTGRVCSQILRTGVGLKRSDRAFLLDMQHRTVVRPTHWEAIHRLWRTHIPWAWQCVPGSIEAEEKARRRRWIAEHWEIMRNADLSELLAEQEKERSLSASPTPPSG